jgi:hypothetical protein
LPKNIRNHRTVTRPASSVWKFRLHSLNSLQKTHRQKFGREKPSFEAAETTSRFGVDNSQKVAAAKVGFHLTDRN